MRWNTPERNAPCRTEWFYLFGHLTGLTKLSYERRESRPSDNVSRNPIEDCNRLYAALSKMTGLQELTMAKLSLSVGRHAEMPGKIGSLQQLRYITLHRSCAKLCHLVCPHVLFGAQIGL